MVGAGWSMAGCGVVVVDRDSCIRCPMLQVDPRMITRLDETGEDLQTRRQRGSRGWIVEMECIEITLTFLHRKRSEAQRLDQRTASLGIPTFRR